MADDWQKHGTAAKLYSHQLRGSYIIYGAKCHSLSFSLLFFLPTKLYFGNATLASIPSFQLDRFHECSCYDHIAPLLCHLHWLQAPQRISFKLAAMVYTVPASMNLDRPTRLMPFSQSPGFLVDNACSNHRPRLWMFHLHDCSLLATEHSPSLWQEHGTPGTVCELK